MLISHHFTHQSYDSTVDTIVDLPFKLAKITKKPFKGISATAEKPFEKIHLDLIGPIDPKSKEGHRYILTVVDNYSGYLDGFPLKAKDDTWMKGRTEQSWNQCERRSIPPV
ncbi:hypothetical protein VP01_58g2 [Puccinia sorghi]|uniref:Integrase catalytic domain-containing protein n=1 Tax=Puccinia sorghi TaxID=27349 RepID=A0A0L6UHS3_9BASI|nr:hypothetical protein VP01_58g2 [Puccinia sorghi]